MSKRTPEPLHPITPEQVAEFRRLTEIWTDLLHLKDWRVRFSRKRPVANVADVEIFPTDRLARISIGRDWGSEAPDEWELEDTVVHELLHIKLYDLAEAAEKASPDTAAALEHAIIIPLAQTLVRMRRKSEQ